MSVSGRAANKSTIITVNLTFERCVEVFGVPALTSAIVDRLTYRAILIDTEGGFYRPRETLRANEAGFDFRREEKNDEKNQNT